VIFFALNTPAGLDWANSSIEQSLCRSKRLNSSSRGGRVKLDTHVHTVCSGKSTLKPLDHLLLESYNAVEDVYRLAKSRGMDLVAVTDHDEIDGALTIAHRPDVIVGCEVTGVFRDGVRVHLGVLGLNESQHRQIQRLRHDVLELLPYLREERLFTSLNHVASRINGSITASHIGGSFQRDLLVDLVARPTRLAPLPEAA
jgi:hypothetical protein